MSLQISHFESASTRLSLEDFESRGYRFRILDTYCDPLFLGTKLLLIDTCRFYEKFQSYKVSSKRLDEKWSSDQIFLRKIRKYPKLPPTFVGPLFS